MRDAFGDVLLDFLPRARGGGLLQFLARRSISARHRFSRLPCRNVQLDSGLTWTLARARVGARALSADREALAMTRAAVAAEIDEALDRHLHLAAQIAFHRKALHALAQALELGVVQILDLARALHAGRGADRLRARASDAV